MKEKRKEITRKEFNRHLEFNNQPIDKGILHHVKILKENGVDTFMSCQGGKGHTFSSPTIRFRCTKKEAFKALSVAVDNDLSPMALNEIRLLIGKKIAFGPFWELQFHHQKIDEILNEKEKKENQTPKVQG